MKSFFVKIPGPPLIILIVLLTAATLLACGPASQTEPQAQPTAQTAAQESDAEPTPTPTPTPTPAEKYPKLDSVLQKIVGEFDVGELTETQAAERASAHHGSTVLVEIGTSTESIDAVDAWMGEQEISPRFKDANYAYTPHIYAYVKVSLLGPLSNRDGVTNVWPVDDAQVMLDDAPSGVGGQVGDASSKPKLPYGLKDYPYPSMSSTLEYLVYLYEIGEITAEEAARRTGVAAAGDAIWIEAYINAEGNSKNIVAWLTSEGFTSPDMRALDGLLDGPVPVRLLGALSKRPGVWHMDISGAEPQPDGLSGNIVELDREHQMDNPEQVAPTPTPKVVARDSDSDPTPTPTPTPTTEPPKYLNLVNLLRNIVAKYEAEELSETAAAAKAPVYHASSVLVEVDLPTNIDVVYTWMGNQDI